MTKRILQPAGWPRPKGYSDGIAARGRLVFTAGVIGWNDEHLFEHLGLAGQFKQALVNTLAILAEGGAGPADIVRMTCYVTSRRDYIDGAKEIGAAWRDILGKTYPCMTVVEVSSLIEEAAKVEIETTAVVEDEV